MGIMMLNNKVLMSGNQMALYVPPPPAKGDAPSLQSKSVTYTANGTATITPDEGYDGLSIVDVTVTIPVYDGSVT